MTVTNHFVTTDLERRMEAFNSLWSEYVKRMESKNC